MLALGWLTLDYQPSRQANLGKTVVIKLYDTTVVVDIGNEPTIMDVAIGVKGGNLIFGAEEFVHVFILP